jgi:hypothetical protein
MTYTAAWPEFVQCAGSGGARAHLKARLTGIQKAHRTGDRQLRFLIQQYLTSFDARLAATRLAASKMRWYRRPEETELKTIAKRLNAFQGTQEEVRLRLIQKGANAFRPTLDFGIETARFSISCCRSSMPSPNCTPDNSQLVAGYLRPSPRS